MQNNSSKQYLLGLALCLSIGFSGYYFEQKIEDDFRGEIKKSLLVLLQTSRSAISIITNNYKLAITATTELPLMVESIETLISVDNDQGLSRLQAETVIDQINQQIINTYKFDHYYILTLDRKLLASSNTNPVNFKILDEQHPYFLLGVWDGNATTTYPHRPVFKKPITSLADRSAAISIFFGAPIKNNDGSMIAALILSVNPEIEYGKILSSARIGETGETYVIDPQGLLLSNSRFSPQLVRKGILANNASSTLNIKVDLSSIDTNDFDDKKDAVFFNLEGYSNYRDEIVIGAKLWDPQRHLFIVTEVEKSQAYSSIIAIRQIGMTAFLLVCLLIYTLIFLFQKHKQRLNASKTLLKKSKLRLRLAFENIPSGNIVSDRNGIIEEFSKSAETILGYTSAEMVGQCIEKIIPEPYQSHHKHYLKRYLSTGEERIIGTGGRDITAVHKNGSFIPIHICIGTMVIDYELFFIASITDRTLLSKMEQQLFNFQKMKAVGQLASGLAHDFNNLLGIAMGNLQLLQRKSSLDDNAIKKIATALQALERGATLTNQLLNFTRANELNSTNIDINKGIMGIKNLIEQTATKKVSVKYFLADNLDFIDMNFGDFGDALINLAANARDAMPDGGDLIIETSSYTSDVFQQDSSQKSSSTTYIQLSISDTGEGMDSEKMSHIFEPFFTTKEQNKGTGLGLAMVESFIKKSKGEIRVYSEVGTGTVFKLFFPVCKQATDKPAIIAPTESIAGGQETILLVDDEKELLTIAEVNLEDAGYKVFTANNGQQALELIKTHDIDLLLTDIIMPGEINGFELSLLALSYKPSLKVSLTSGFTANASEKMIEGNLLAKYLARSLLPKPYSRKELLTHLRKQLDIKPRMQWTNKISVGVKAIDYDHRVLIAITNHLNSILEKNDDDQNEEIARLLTDLISYAKSHSHREEVIMKACHFPNIKEHSKNHQKLEQKINSLIKFNNEPVSHEEKNALMLFLNGWITEHIGKEDQQFAPYVSQYLAEIEQALKDDFKLTG